MKKKNVFLLALCCVTQLFGAETKIKAVIFDCDGTLVDSELAHYHGWKKAITTFGGDLTLDDYYQYVGKSGHAIADLFAEKVGQDCAEGILKIQREFYHEELCKGNIAPILPTVNFLKCLAEQKESLGIKIGVCSAAMKTHVLAHMKNLQIEHLVDIVLSGQTDLFEYHDPEGVNKPKPYIYLHAMKQLGVSPENTIVIEDSGPGVTAGVSAGCFTIAIPNDYTKRHDLSHAQKELNSFEDMSIEELFQMATRS